MIRDNAAHLRRFVAAEFLKSWSFQMSLAIANCAFGRGVFAGVDFQQGEQILQFTGPQIGLAAALRKGELQGNTLQISPDSYIDIEEPGVLVNHSCEPNSGVVNDSFLIALRSIRAGEEITYDYSTTMLDGTWELTCHCATKECRGIVRDFTFLPASTQSRYLKLGVVQGFIARQYSKESGC